VTTAVLPSPKQVLTDPALFSRYFLKILDRADEGKEERMLIPLRLNTAQKSLVANLGRRNLILKARQLGMSTAVQAELFRLSLIKTVTTATLAHDDDTTQKLRRMTDRFYHNIPQLSDCQVPVKKYSNATLSLYADFDSEAVIATGGSKNKGRGGTYTHVHCSEVAFYKDAEAIMAGILQGGSPVMILESTPNGAQGYFFEKCMEALDGSKSWKLHFFPWWWDKEYRIALEPGESLDFSDDETRLMRLHNLTAEQIKWRREKQSELKRLFMQEYPEHPKTCFLLSGNGYFGDVSHAAIAPENAQPHPDHAYYAGLDFAQTVDYTVLSIVDRNTGQQVAILRINRLPWKEMRRQVIEWCLRWQVKGLQAEENSMGSTNIEALREEMKIAGCSTQITAFQTTNQSKHGVMADLSDALQEHYLTILPDENQLHEIHAFTARQTISMNWVLSAPDGGHDDTVIALALAWHAANTRPQHARNIPLAKNAGRRGH
jgi:hypothetical protein